MSPEIDAVLSGASRWCVIEGDCLDVMRGMPDQCVHHMITDPPYEAEAHTQQRRVRRGPGDRNARVEPLNFEPIEESTRVCSMLQAARLCTRWVMAFCQAEAVSAWRESMTGSGLAWRRSCIWVKPDGMPQLTGDRPGMGYESIAVAHAQARSTWNGGGRVGVFTHNKNDPTGAVCGRNPHPTQKPTSLMAELISLFTDPDEIVLDPFAGSGTTGVAALRLGRRAILIERDPTYAALARDRMLAECDGSTLQAYRAGQLPLLGG